MNKSLFLIIFFLLCGISAAFAQNTVTHSAVTFKIKNLGVTVEGKLEGLQANVQFNPANLVAAIIEASVDVNTLSTNNLTRDEHLKSDEFFGKAHYPKILLKSVSIKHSDGNNYIGQFNLTIKNKTKTVQIPFTYSSKRNVTAFSGSFKINRLDFDLGSGSLALSNEVFIFVDVAFRD